MPRFLILGIAVVVVLTVYAVVDCAMSDARRIRVLSKPLWLVAILLLPVVGPICWILFGKGLVTLGSSSSSSSSSAGAGGRGAAGSARAGASPDDDAEFLRRLRAETAAERRKLEAERGVAGEPPSGEERAAQGRAGAADSGTAGSGTAGSGTADAHPNGDADAEPTEDEDRADGR